MAYSQIKESEILSKVKDAFNELCPVSLHRICIDEETYSFKCVELDLDFYFYTDDCKDYVVFAIKKRKDIREFGYILEGNISNDTIKELIIFLSQNFRYINGLRKVEKTGLEINFGIDMCDFVSQGFSCSKVNLRFSTYFKLYDIYKSLFDGYFEFIVLNFFIKLGRVPEFRQAWQQYMTERRTNIINSLTYDKFIELVSLFNENQLKKLLLGTLSDEEFFEILSKLEEKPKDDDLLVRRLVEKL